MSHISDLFKKVDELQTQIDNLKTENDTLKGVIKDKTGVDIDEAKDDATADNTDDSKKDDPVKPVTATSKPNCPVKLNYQQGLVAGRILQQLQRKALSITQLLNLIEDKLIRDPKFTLDIRRQKKN